MSESSKRSKKKDKAKLEVKKEEPPLSEEKEQEADSAENTTDPMDQEQSKSTNGAQDTAVTTKESKQAGQEQNSEQQSEQLATGEEAPAKENQKEIHKAQGNQVMTLREDMAEQQVEKQTQIATQSAQLKQPQSLGQAEGQQNTSQKPQPQLIQAHTLQEQGSTHQSSTTASIAASTEAQPSEQESKHPPQKPLEETAEPIILIPTNCSPGGSNEDLDQDQTAKQTKTSKRLAKFKEKKKNSAPKKQQRSPEFQKQSIPSKSSSLNQTVSSIKSKFVKQSFLPQETDVDESKMLQMVMQSKKRQNYRTLKQWDDKLAYELCFHLSVVQGFERSLDALARTSFDNIQLYVSTFRVIYNQQEKFASHPMIDTVYATKNNSISKNIYINCSCILNALNEENMERAKRAKEFAQFIRTDVLEGLLGAHMKKSQQNIATIKTRISELRSALRSTQAELDLSIQRLVGFISENISSSEGSKDRDFYEDELAFLRLSKAIVGLHQQYAQLVLEYYQIARDMEGQRADCIKKAIKVYSEGLEATYQSKTAKESLEQLEKGQEEKLIDEFYALEELLPVNIQNLIKQKINVVQEGFALEHLKRYFKGFSVESFDLRQLILKQYPVKNAAADAENSTLLITVNKFVHIFTTLEGYAEPTASYKIDQLLRVKRKGCQVQFQRLPEKKGGVLGILGWSSKGLSSTAVVFGKKDSAQQAEDYIRKLM